MTERLVLWEGLDGWRAEAAVVELTGEGVRATGTQLGIDPLPYRVDYALDASERFVTRRLVVEARGSGWRRRIELSHDGEGGWHCAADAAGEADLPAPGGPLDGLNHARDCDLGFSPLTNLMPVRRARLHERDGALDLVAAWVSVPDLALLVSAQRYEHVRREDDGALVRYVDRGLFPGFTVELQLDPDGLVRDYPGLARRR